MHKVTTADIYVIRCLANSRVYVGSAKRSAIRLRTHWNELAKGTHANPFLRRAWNKYGAESFSTEVVEVCSLEDRWVREQWWIDKLDAGKNRSGFNIVSMVQQLPSGSILSKRLKVYWKKRWNDPVYAARRTKELKDVANKPGVRASMSASKKKNWLDPAYRQIQTQKHKEYAANPENREKLRSAAKALWADPVYREKQLAERRKRFKDPTFLAKLSEAASKRPSRVFINVHDEIV